MYLYCIMTTRKELILNLFEDFDKKVKSKIGDINIFNIDLNTIEENMIDFIMFFNLTFSFTDNYKEIVNDLIEVNQVPINKLQFEEMYPDIENFINDFKKIQKI